MGDGWVGRPLLLFFSNAVHFPPVSLLAIDEPVPGYTTVEGKGGEEKNETKTEN